MFQLKIYNKSVVVINDRKKSTETHTIIKSQLGDNYLLFTENLSTSSHSVELVDYQFLIDAFGESMAHRVAREVKKTSAQLAGM